MKKEEIHQGDELIFSTTASDVVDRYRGHKCKVIAVDVTADGEWMVNIEYTTILSGKNKRIWDSDPNHFERPLCKENEGLDAMFAEF
jgi:hypothetical protein